MNLQLQGKVFLITGGAKGIGQAIARATAEEGAYPVITDADTDAMDQLRAELTRGGASCHFIQGNLKDVETCERSVQEAVAKFGRLDGLVNNAGVNDGVGLEKGTPSEFVCSLERNLLHYYNMAHFALPHLKKTSGTIVNIASKTAVTGQGGTSGYVASKGAILALTREWAAELLPYEIRVNAVVPAEVMTPLYRKWLNQFPHPEEKLAWVTSKIPLAKRMTAPSEIGSAVLFLLSAQAGHITGQHIYVDGGYVHLDRALT